MVRATAEADIKGPKAPDPVATAQAQAGFNSDAAQQSQLMNMIGQSGPWGSVGYNQTGTTSFVDSTGRTVTVPQYTQTTTFTPEQQAIFDATQGAETNLANIAKDQSAYIKQHLSQPFEFNNSDAEQWAYDLASPRLLQQQQVDSDRIRSQLINSGLRPGTQAYDREMTRLTQNQGDQLNQLALTGRNQAFGEALAVRNQPINEITALLNGSQVENPAQMYGSTPQTQIGAPDYMGQVNQNYQAKLQSQGAMMGGLFSALGTVGGQLIAKSDIRVKENVERVGTLHNGLPIYAYNYVDGGLRHVGVMAQDVELVRPDAVIEIDGIKHVNYTRALQ